MQWGGMLNTEGDGEDGGTGTSFLIVKNKQGNMTRGFLSPAVLALTCHSMDIALSCD